jgi:hypothetical protein
VRPVGALDGLLVRQVGVQEAKPERDGDVKRSLALRLTGKGPKFVTQSIKDGVAGLQVGIRHANQKLLSTIADQLTGASFLGLGNNRGDSAPITGAMGHWA